jgi:hypothetical protein
VLLPYALATAIGGLPWGILLPRQARLRRLALVESRFAASSASSALPFFGLGGEPARLLWLAEPYRAQGTAALLVDRLLYNSANGCTLCIGALVGGAFTPLPASWALTAAVLGWLTLGATLGLGWLVTRHGVGHRAEALFVRLFGAPAKQTNFGARVDAALRELIRGSRRRLLKGFLVHLVAKLVLALEVAVGLWSLGGGVDMARVLVLAVVPIALSFFFSSVPGQLGIQEGTQTLVASALQLSPGLVLSMVVLQRFRQLVFMALLPSLLATANADDKLDARRSPAAM